MTDETEVSAAEFFKYDSTDDTEDMSFDISSPVTAFLREMGKVVILATAGYMLGWAASLLWERFHNA